MSQIPLKLLEQTLGIDENHFVDSLDEETKKLISKSQKNFKYQTLTLLSQQHLENDCKSSFSCWKNTQLVAYFNLQASRLNQLNSEQQLEKIQEAENILTPSHIQKDFLGDINYKILSVMFVVEKMRVSLQMSDLIKCVKIFLKHEEMLKSLNYIEELLQRPDIKSQEKRKYEFFLLIKSQIYLIYAFTMQKVQQFSESIRAYEIYLNIKEKLLNFDFVSDSFKQKEQQNAYYSLFIYFYYKYCKSLTKDKQDEKALQSICNANFMLNNFESNYFIKKQDIQKFKIKFTKLNQKVEDLIKKNVVSNMHQQNQILKVQSPKYQDEQLKQLRIYFKMSKQSENEQKKQNNLNRSKSEGAMQAYSINNESNGKIEISKIDIQNRENNENFQREEQFNESKQNSLKNQNSFISNLDYLNSFLDEEQLEQSYINNNFNQMEYEQLCNNLKAEEEEQNINEKYKKLIVKKEIDIKGLTDRQQPKKLTPLNVLLAQSDIMMDQYFNIKKFQTEYGQINKNETAKINTEPNQEYQNLSKAFDKYNIIKQDFALSQRCKSLYFNETLPMNLITNNTQVNASNMNTQLDSRRVSNLHSQRYKNNSLWSQNSQLMSANHSRDLQRRYSGQNKWIVNQFNSTINSQTKQTQRGDESNKNQQIEKDNIKENFLTKKKLSLNLNLNKIREDDQLSQNAPSQLQSKQQIVSEFKNKHIQVYSNAFRTKSGSMTDRPRLSTNNNTFQQIRNNKVTSQEKNSVFKIKSALTSPRNSQRTDQINRQKYKTPIHQRLKTNCELIKDLDIEFELQYLMVKNKQSFQNNLQKEFIQKPNLIARPLNEVQNNFQMQIENNKNNNSFDSNKSIYQKINYKIPNIIKFIQDNKNGLKSESLHQKYLNLAQFDPIIKKRLNSMAFENIQNKKDTKDTNLAQSELMTKINQRNQFITGIQKFSQEDQQHIIKHGGVVYNEKLEDFDYMKSDKYGQGFMNQDLEEKLKSVKEELKKIQFIPPKPPTEIEISSKTESDFLNISNQELLQQSNAIVNRFKQQLQIELDGINENNLFVNHELSSKSSNTFRSFYKSQFQRYANKDFYLNQIAQHRITIHKGGQDENFTNTTQNILRRQETEQYNLSNQSNYDNLFEQNIQTENQIEDYDENFYENDENAKTLKEIVHFIKSDQGEKRISLSDYSYSFVDNFTEMNNSLVGSQLLLNNNQEKFSTTPRNMTQKKDSIFLKRQQSLISDFGLKKDQENNMDVSLVLNELNNQGESQNRQPSFLINKRFQNYKLEKKLSLFVNEKASNSPKNESLLKINHSSPLEEESEYAESPQKQKRVTLNDTKKTLLNTNQLKEDDEEYLTSIRVINQNQNIKKTEFHSFQCIQNDQNQQQREKYQRTQTQKNKTYTAQSPRLSTNLILFNHINNNEISPVKLVTLQQIFHKFQNNDDKQEIKEREIQESPYQQPRRLSIKMNYDPTNNDDQFIKQSKEISEFNSQIFESSSFDYHKEQSSKNKNQFKLQLHSLKPMEQLEKSQIQENLLEKSISISRSRKLSEQSAQSRKSNQNEKYKPTKFQVQHNLLSIPILHHDSCMKIQQFFRKYTSQKKLIKQILNKRSSVYTKKSQKYIEEEQKTTLERKQHKAKNKNQAQQTINHSTRFSQVFQQFTGINQNIRHIIQARIFQQKIRESQSGLINNKSPFDKFYPPFKFTRLIQGVPVSWKVKHIFKKENFGSTEINQYFLTILFRNTRFSLKVDLDFAGLQLKNIEFKTLWPLYLLAFEKYLRDQNIKIYVTKPQNDIKIKNLPYNLSFLEGLTEKLKSQLTDFDLNCIGNLKDLLEIYLKHFFEFHQKANGQVLEYNKHQIFPQWKLILVKNAQKKLDRFISMSIEGQKSHKEDYRKHKKEYELALTNNERVLQNNLVRFIKENHLLGVFIKRSTGGYYYLLTVKVNFRQSNNISTQIVNGQLMLSDFSFYITGRNLGTYQTILPLEVHASQVAKYFTPNTLVREINKFFLRKRLSHRWIMILIDFFSQHLCLTLPKTDRDRIIHHQKTSKIQKLIFRDIMEIRRRIQQESQKQVLLQNPFNDFFLIEQIKRNSNSNADQQNEKKEDKYEHISDKNFITIQKEFYKNQLEEAYEKNDFSLFHEDDELDKRYEDGGYYQTREEILKQPPQEDVIEVQKQGIKEIVVEDLKQIKQGNQIRNKYLSAVNSNYFLNLQHQLEGFWRLSNLFDNGRSIRQKVFFATMGTYLWVRIQFDILKGVIIVHISDYWQSVYYEQIVRNQKVKLNLLNMSTLALESDQNLSEKIKENLRQIAFQGILQKEKSLLGHKIKIKTVREEDTLKNPVLLKNKESVKNHLLIDSVELKEHYDIDEYISILNHKEFGKIICTIKTYIINKAIDQSAANTYLFRLTIQLYKSKHYSFKIILGFDDIYNLDKQLYSNLLKQYNKIYAQRLINLTMSRIQLVPTLQGKIPCFFDIKRKNALKTNENNQGQKNMLNQEENQNVGLSCLKFKRNRFAKVAFTLNNLQQQKTMLEDYVQQSRVIFQGIKKFQGEYCIVTVSKDILLRYWVFNIYVPKTCRVLVSYFNNSDMMDCSEEFLAKQMSQKIIYFFENPQMTPFKSYRDFIKRISLNKNIQSSKRKSKQNKPPKTNANQSSSKQKIIYDTQNKIDNLHLLSSQSSSRSLSPSKKVIKQTKQQIYTNFEPKRNSVLDLKFEFQNFNDKFNDLREVFEPGIQKKRSFSSGSSSSDNSLSQKSIFSQNLSPIQSSHKNSRIYDQKKSIAFNFQKVEMEDIPDLQLNSNHIISPGIKRDNVLNINYQHRHSESLERYYFNKNTNQSNNQMKTNSSNSFLIQQSKIGADIPVQSFHRIESRNKLIQKLKTQEQIQIPNNLNEQNSNQISQKFIQDDKNYVNSNRQISQQFASKRISQFQSFQRQAERRKSEFISFQRIRQPPIAQKEQIQQAKQIYPCQNNQQYKQETFNTEFQRKQSRKSLTIFQKQNLRQTEEATNYIDLSPLPSLNLQSKKLLNLKQKTISRQSEKIIEENKKLVNQIFIQNQDRRVSLMNNTRNSKQNLKSIYASLLKQRAIQQQNETFLNNNQQKQQKVVPSRQHKAKLTIILKRGMQYYIKKHFIKLLVIIHCQQYIDMKRIGDKVKIQRTQKFFDLTKFLDDAFVSQKFNVRITNLIKFIEIRLWENLIAQSRLEADLQSEHILFCFENSKLPLHELMFHDFVQIEGNSSHDFNTEICINFIDIIQNKGLKQAKKRIVNVNKKSKNKKVMMENFYFTPLDWISYPMTSYFNMYIQNFNLEEGFIQTDIVNLREILNIYIAEGYYKFQTNYINSKLSYSDIKSLCQFVVHKMKTSNFLNVIKSQVGINNEGISQKFSIEENIRQKANYMKRMKTQPQKESDNLQGLKSIFVKEQNKQTKNYKDAKNYQQQFIVQKIKILDAFKGIILKSQYIPSQKEFKFVVLETNNKSNTTRYKPYEFFSEKIQFLDQYYKSQKYDEILDKVVIFFQKQMLLYHNTSA
ncbi:hypothetical protein ABPG72_022721 [Tetrahymena utriculariae]